MNLKDNRVMILYCNRYEVNLIKERLKDGLEPWGGIRAFVKPGQKVLLKANLLMAKKPEEAATTHPAVVHAVAELVHEADGKAIIGDSPGGPFNRTLLQRVYRRTGMEAVAVATGAELNWEFGFVKHSFPEGKILKNVTVGKYIKNADLIINLPKLKTHGLTKMTGGVKNLFGAIPGLLKAEYHLNMQKIDDFADALIDIALFVSPGLTIMDGIIGMEGEGPSGGKPIELNTLLVSPNPFALDVVMAELVKIKPEKIPTIKMAKKRGLGYELKDVQLLGDPIGRLKPENFNSPNIDYSAKLLERRLPKPLAKWMTGLLRPKPVFDPEICVQCGDCIRSCPPQVIQKLEKGVNADLDKCIRCFCCQELCPKQAIRIHRPMLGRILFGK
ncbi:hypothetical protein BBF96_05600 [Anoxybacter fermentans]|uniref:Ferredoxin n=1 Tax=Anoxybacter fermentans TaxID=1323375 RepID=A0A3Q9HPR5_9FIRM|nr:DUF362 domain-containing protein [Anoxybacter fermentans]AZR72910.1 hypothetical protein BBF96_05600 [Anoxybacter fermentans]